MIVILTALESEYAAVRAHLVDVEVRRHHAGTVFEVGAIASRQGGRIAVAATGMGNLSAATLTERAIGEFRPTAMLFVGVAGGLRDWLQLGDVVVATRVYAYHGGRSEDDEFLVRPRAWEISHKIEQAARYLHRTNGWRDLLPAEPGTPEPAVHFEAIAAGEVVLNSRQSTHAQHLRHNFNDAVAVEMEGAGFAHAGHLNGNVPLAAIRAISDDAAGGKDVTDSEGWQPIAARNAAAFAVALSAALDDPDPGTREDQRTSHSIPSIQNTNIAKGRARVAQQNGVNFGDVAANSHPTGENR